MMEIQSSRKKNIFISMLFISCFSAIFYLYHKSTLNWLQHPTFHFYKHNTWINAFQASRQNNNNTVTVNQPLIENKLKPTTQTQETLLLIWMWPFGDKFDLGSCSSVFRLEGCRLTDDRNLFSEAHGVLFHHGDMDNDLSNMPTQTRPSFQKWIWMNMESPSNSALYSYLNDLFNLTVTYRRDSDIMIPYGRISQKNSLDRFQLPHKEKLVCWIVSNWKPEYERSKYFLNLKEHINVETYGDVFNRQITNEEYSELVSSCKFYLSFENSIHPDYITEKLFNPMAVGTVPVVLGPSRRNYEKFIPGSAFIHVNDYKSAEDLAAHLKYLDKNKEMYMKYFSWRETFVVSRTDFGLEQACHACDYIRRNRNYRVMNDLISWFWDL
ncbi:4-galactosyl-N-acetylglucosaminide 3-alpha-L-fucosyltransferase 9 [Misgurnus anguillicaudatus]|uniref:4-galactosyl-N-acetylglucosaminide 3-alpha-L-fucosyltransferase 9 n=1 Tax=Misgurnus anguillicaudatus TaxID=75329 RepID=UPI003CCFB4C1